MVLHELIEELRKRNPDTVVRNGFGSGHSDRGNYCNAAFDPVEETTFGEMLKNAIDILDSTQDGYKGGEYVMSGWAEALIGYYGNCGENITKYHFLYWDTFIQPNAQITGPKAPVY